MYEHICRIEHTVKTDLQAFGVLLSGGGGGGGCFRGRRARMRSRSRSSKKLVEADSYEEGEQGFGEVFLLSVDLTQLTTY
jgi:hypothetical protein